MKILSIYYICSEAFCSALIFLFLSFMFLLCLGLVLFAFWTPSPTSLVFISFKIGILLGNCDHFGWKWSICCFITQFLLFWGTQLLLTCSKWKSSFILVKHKDFSISAFEWYWVILLFDFQWVISLFQSLFWFKVFECPTMNKWFLALVIATFILRKSLRKPIDVPSPPALTQDIMMISFSRPWKESTVLISATLSRFQTFSSILILFRNSHRSASRINLVCLFVRSDDSYLIICSIEIIDLHSVFVKDFNNTCD